MDAIVDSLVQRQDFPGPSSEKRCEIRIIFWDEVKKDFALRHFHPLTREERLSHVQVTVADYLVGWPKEGDKAAELIVPVTPLGQNSGRLTPFFYKVEMDRPNHVSGGSIYFGY